MVLDESKLLTEENLKKDGYKKLRHNMFFKREANSESLWLRCSYCNRFGFNAKWQRIPENLQWTCQYCDVQHLLRGPQRVALISK